MPEPSVPKFNGLVGKLGTLVSSSRRNQKLIDSVTTIRLAITEDFWQDTLPYPPLDEELWWEIWLRGSRQDANEIFHRFVDIAAAIGIDRVSDRYVSFPERLVLHAYASARQISSSIHLLSMIAELRKAKELATPYVTMSARDQRDFVDDAARLIVPPGEECAERLHPRRRGQSTAPATRTGPRPRGCPGRRGGLGDGGPRPTNSTARGWPGSHSTAASRD